MLLSVVVASAVVLAANWCWQVWRKPTEIVGLLDVWNYKTPRELWTAYGPVFKEKSTSIMTPELLAALAHVETGGNPIARTYWKWSWSADWDRVFAPASSAAGMFQIIDGTLKEAENFCVKEGRVFRDRGRRRECAHKVAFSRLFPTDAVEMTAARLHWEAERIAAEVYSRKRARTLDLNTYRKIAVVAHLCGAGAAERFARAHFSWQSLGRCGDHSPQRYYERVRRLSLTFKNYN